MKTKKDIRYAPSFGLAAGQSVGQKDDGERWTVNLCVNGRMCVHDGNAAWHIWNETVVAMAQSQEETDCGVNDLHLHLVLACGQFLYDIPRQYRILANLIFIYVNIINDFKTLWKMFLFFAINSKYMKNILDITDLLEMKEL